MKQDETIMMTRGKNILPSRLPASIEAKDVGIAGVALFMCLMIACALFFS